MEPTTLIDASTIAAWWGAIIASVVLLWDIFKWFTKGARMRVTAAPNMQEVNNNTGKLDDKKTIFVEACNVGDLSTTITHLLVYEYNSRWDRLRNKPSQHGFIPIKGSFALPYFLASGGRWDGQIDQEDVIEKYDTDKLIYCGIAHTFSKKPKLVKVDLKERT
jgi:hypothetical protein